MKYEMLDGRHLYLPEDPFETRLVFEVLRGRLELEVPRQFYVDREEESCEQFCRLGWWAWTFILPWPRPGGAGGEGGGGRGRGDIFILMVDVALPVNFRNTSEDLACRFSHWQTAGVDDPSDLLGVLRERVDERMRGVEGKRLLGYLRALSRVVPKMEV